MAAARSLGISAPSALQHLIDEGLLPADPSSDQYVWHSEAGSPEDDFADELVITSSCIVWSRQAVVQRVFNFEIEQEAVTSALFVTFPQDVDQGGIQISPQSLHQSSFKFTDADRLPHIRNRPNRTNAGTQQADGLEKQNHSKRRALVILLKTQAHVFFLSGTGHIVNLPFEPAGAFATPFGLVIQRDTGAKSRGLALQLPSKTPVNTFSLPVIESFKSATSLGSSSAAKDEPPWLTTMFRSLTTSASQSSSNQLPHHIYLRDPLTEMGIVGELEDKNSSVPGRFGLTQSNYSHLPGTEKIVYISPRSELAQSKSGSAVLLALTWNASLTQYTIWKVLQTPARLNDKKQR